MQPRASDCRSFLRHPGSVRAMDLSTNGSQAVTLCSTGKDQFRVSLWDVATGAERACEVTLAGQALTSVVFHPNQRSAILASSGNGKSRLLKWDFSATELAPLWPGRDMRGTVWSAVFSPDGSRLLAVGGTPGQAVDRGQGRAGADVQPARSGRGGQFFAAGPNGGDVQQRRRREALVCRSGRCRVWPRASCAWSGRIAVPNRSAAINFVAFAPHETAEEATLLTAGDDGTARLLAHRGQGRNAAGGAGRPSGPGPFGRLCARVDSSSSRPAMTRRPGCGMRKTGEPIGGAGGVLQHPEMVLFATFSPDGTLAITGCDDNNAYVWNMRGGTARQR